MKLLISALVLVVSLYSFLPASSDASERPKLSPRENNYERSAVAGGVMTTPAASAQDLIDCLLGPDVVVTNVNLIRAADGSSAGTFSGGAAIFGFDEGIILSSGSIVTASGPNTSDGASQNNGLPGDSDLEALIPGFTTNDATILEFDLVCPGDGMVELSFSYVFASEEYNEYVFSDFNDVFAFFVGGTNPTDNIAVVPNACSDSGIPVAIDNVNCDNPFGGIGVNCNCYRNNDLDDGGGAINTEMDGLTEVFFASKVVQQGVPVSVKLAIADAGDFVLDSNVMIRCESFVCEPPQQTGGCCLDDGSCIVTTQDDCAAAGGDYQGDQTLCDPDPCVLPVDESTWGRIKSHYRD